MRIKYIDVLKAVAIIAVVLYHAGFLTYGYLGVDLFLVIGGYMVTRSLYPKLINIENLGNGGYFQFEFNRTLRLLPPLLVAGAVCMAMGFIFMVDSYYESLSQSVIATNFFGNNVVELISTGDYWASDKMYSPLMHTWYVGLIMQFYIVYPILFYFAKLDKKAPKRSLIVLIGIVAFISMLLYMADTDTARKFYLLPARFFEFAVGGIVALCYVPTRDKLFRKPFVYFCYALLLAILVINIELIPANIKLLLVVAISCVLLCSQNSLENRITGNESLAKIGAASYSIFIWHQIVLAFGRILSLGQMGIASYCICLIVTIILSWLSYLFIEQRIGVLLKKDNGKSRLLIAYGALFVLLNAGSLLVYKNAGVVRDIPELEVSAHYPQREMWPAYTNRVFKEDKDFETEKPHWLVIGNSFGRDFLNIIYESPVADIVELSYVGSKEYMERKYEPRFSKADKIFVASKGYDEKMVHDIEIIARSFGLKDKDVIVVGEKYFGENINQIYARRFYSDYMQTSVSVKEDIFDKNHHYRQLYGERFINLLSAAINAKGKVTVFTTEAKLFSYDCIHLTKSGACDYAKVIDWNKYFNE